MTRPPLLTSSSPLSPPPCARVPRPPCNALCFAPSSVPPFPLPHTASLFECPSLRCYPCFCSTLSQQSRGRRSAKGSFRVLSPLRRRCCCRCWRALSRRPVAAPRQQPATCGQRESSRDCPPPCRAPRSAAAAPCARHGSRARERLDSTARSQRQAAASSAQVLTEPQLSHPICLPSLTSRACPS